jgi:hypothetical protein
MKGTKLHAAASHSTNAVIPWSVTVASELPGPS